jgi:hypothetical protein
VAGTPAIDPETDVGEIMRKRSAHIGEGICGAATGRIVPRGDLLHAGRLEPGDGGGHDAEIELVGDRIGGAV